MNNTPPSRPFSRFHQKMFDPRKNLRVAFAERRCCPATFQFTRTRTRSAALNAADRGGGRSTRTTATRPNRFNARSAGELERWTRRHTEFPTKKSLLMEPAPRPSWRMEGHNFRTKHATGTTRLQKTPADRSGDSPDVCGRQTMGEEASRRVGEHNRRREAEPAKRRTALLNEGSPMTEFKTEYQQEPTPPVPTFKVGDVVMYSPNPGSWLHGKVEAEASEHRRYVVRFGPANVRAIDAHDLTLVT